MAGFDLVRYHVLSSIRASIAESNGYEEEAERMRAQGNLRLMVMSDDELKELARMLSLLRARKVFTQTRVLFPTDRGLPASCSVGSIWCLETLHKELGVDVKLIPYREMAEAMDRVLADGPGEEKAHQDAAALLGRADKSYIDKKYVVRSLQFYPCPSFHCLYFTRSFSRKYSDNARIAASSTCPRPIM